MNTGRIKGLHSDARFSPRIQFATGTNATSLEFSYVVGGWLPPSCERPKYIPTWHLVRSYRQ